MPLTVPGPGHGQPELGRHSPGARNRRDRAAD